MTLPRSQHSVMDFVGWKQGLEERHLDAEQRGAGLGATGRREGGGSGKKLRARGGAVPPKETRKHR